MLTYKAPVEEDHAPDTHSRVAMTGEDGLLVHRQISNPSVRKQTIRINRSVHRIIGAGKWIFFLRNYTPLQRFYIIAEHSQ